MCRYARLLAVTAALLYAGAAGAQVRVTSPLPGVRMAYGVNGGHPSALLVVDLCAPGISVRTTRYSERNALASEWAAHTGADLAVNGDLFQYGTYSVIHWARSGGSDWPPGTHDMEPHPNLAVGPGFAIRGDLPPLAAATDVIGGIPEFVIDGMTNMSLPDTDFINGPHRRTAVGLSRDRRTLFIFSTDGTSSVPGIHFGMAVFAAAVPGAPTVWWALNLDGGGSSQMWVRGVGDVIPSSRRVANHLGIFARGSGPAPHCPARDPRCPATGTTHTCVDRTRVADCVNGVIAGTGDCGVYGALCSTARPGEPGCVVAVCVSSPTDPPRDHDACLPDGRILHCTADGGFRDVRACPAGTTCRADADGAGACVVPGAMRDAGTDSGRPDVRVADVDGTNDAPFVSDLGERADAAPGDDGSPDADHGTELDGGPDGGAVQGGCSCRTAPAPGAPGRIAGIVLALGFLARRRGRGGARAR